MKVSDVMAVDHWTEALDGVFTLGDLRVLFGHQSEAALYKKLEGFIAQGILVKVKRGLSTRPDVPLPVIASRIEPTADISLGTVLARHALIGSVPARRVQAVKVGRPRSVTIGDRSIELLSIAPRLFFGFVTEGGVRWARPEKAYVDACYSTYRGASLSFDVAVDVDATRLDTGLLAEYLGPYDPSFVHFFHEMASR